MANAEAPFAGAQGEFVGLDQCNVRLVMSLAGIRFQSVDQCDGECFQPQLQL
jgi:hypothetical protein